MLHHDNTCPHAAAAALDTRSHSGCPYNSDLARFDYHMFRALRDAVSGQRFGNGGNVRGDTFLTEYTSKNTVF